MKIGLLHYHARRGGITRVIEQQMDALKDDAECLFLAGNEADQESGVQPICVPGLGYDGMRSDEPPETVAENVLRAIEEKWPNGCDVLHVHNPILKKNHDFLAILKILQKKGVRLFLQIHDTAEDLRPHSYYLDEEYPENCHYGVINSRDYRLFFEAGLVPEGLHAVHNVVQPLPFETHHQQPPGRRYFLYAVRAIRRKNIGEALLLSCFLPHGFRVGLTLPPTSPGDYPSYEDWKSFSVESKLSVDFELGLGHSLGDLVARSAVMITTSVREGFGFSFLEPWTAGLAVVGRRLDAVSGDFEKQGVDLTSLYSGIAVPLDLVDEPKLRGVWEGIVMGVYRQYGMHSAPEDPSEVWQRISSGGCIDFAYLYPAAARTLIRNCRKDPLFAGKLADANPFLRTMLEPMNNTELIEHNRKAVLENYSRESYRKTLLSIYKKVISTSVVQKIDKKSLLRSFLVPENFLLGGM